MPFVSNGVKLKYHDISVRKCKYCDKPAKLNIIKGRNKGFCKTCGDIKCLKASNTIESVRKSKGRKGSESPRWIKDRTQLKQKRNSYEERELFKEILKERNYKCELTNIGGKLSVHHINGVWSHPEQRFDKNNCIVVLKDIHKKFHLMYGLRATSSDWFWFVIKKEFSDCIPAIKSKKMFINGGKDYTGIRSGFLVAIKKTDKKTKGCNSFKWEFKCDCGKIHYATPSNVFKKKDQIVSCGCRKKEANRNKLLNNPIYHLSSANKKKYV